MIQDCVKEHQSNLIPISPQYIPGKKESEDENCYFQVVFGQVYAGQKPMIKDSRNQKLYPYYPFEARIRNMTYMIDSYVDVHIEKRKRNGTAIGDLCQKYDVQRIELCKIPVMVRSSQCHLSDMNDANIIRHKECMYDQGGYFIINGSEKVIVA